MNISPARNKHASQAYYDEQPPADASSARNMALARVEMLLSEQFIVPFPGEEEPDDFGPVELINVDDIIEVAQLPPPVIALPPAQESQLPDIQPAASAVIAPQKAPSQKISLISATVQILVVLFVMALVFIFGIMVGRGQVWEAGLGHDLVVWLEQKAGWGPQANPEVVIKRSEAQPSTASGLSYQAPPLVVATNVAAVKPDLDLVVEKIALTWDGQQWFEESSARRRTQTDAVKLGNEMEAGSPAPPQPVAETSQPVVSQAATAPPVAAPVVSSPSAPATAASTETTGEKFAVQASSTPDEEEANRQVTQLESRGFTAYAYRNTRGLWMVRVGHFDSHQKADKAKDGLMSLGYKSPYVSRLTN